MLDQADKRARRDAKKGKKLQALVKVLHTEVQQAAGMRAGAGTGEMPRTMLTPLLPRRSRDATKA